MAHTICNRTVSAFLKTLPQRGGFFDALKIKYRSLVCPLPSLLRLVKPGDRVGDVGCGSGQFLLLASHFAAPSYVFGIEITQRLIGNAQELFQTLPSERYGLVTYDGLHFPDTLSTLDTVFLIDVLHHVPRATQAVFIRNLANSLRPGATLVMKDIDAAHPFVYCNKLHDLFFSHQLGHELSMRHASDLLACNGLEIVECHKIVMYAYPHYTLVARKTLSPSNTDKH
jgi:SAM-dependent methyltransferase